MWQKWLRFGFSISKFYAEIIFFLIFLVDVGLLFDKSSIFSKNGPFEKIRSWQKYAIKIDCTRCLGNEYSFSDIPIKLKSLWTNYVLYTWNLYICLALDDEFGSTCNNQCLAGVLSASVFVFILMMLFLVFHKR